MGYQICDTDIRGVETIHSLKGKNMTISIVGHKGFQIALSNGITVSVQFGPGNYCERREEDFTAPEESDFWSSQTAEVAAFVTNSAEALSRNWVHVDGFNSGDDVVGWLDADEVVKFIGKVAAMPNRTKVA